MRLSKQRLHQIIKEEMEQTLEGYEWGEEEDEPRDPGYEPPEPIKDRDPRDNPRLRKAADDYEAKRRREKDAASQKKNRELSDRTSESNFKEFQAALAKYYPEVASLGEEEIGQWAVKIAKEIGRQGSKYMIASFQTKIHPQHVKKWAKMKGLPEVEPEERGMGQKLGSFFKGKGFKEELEKIIKEEIEQVLSEQQPIRGQVNVEFFMGSGMQSKSPRMRGRVEIGNDRSIQWPSGASWDKGKECFRSCREGWQNLDPKEQAIEILKRSEDREAYSLIKKINNGEIVFS